MDKAKTRIINTVPNQKVIRINQVEEASAQNSYGIITRHAEVIAAWLLNDKTAAHILYCHFVLNKDGYEFALSPTEIRNQLGITKKQYDRAISKLEEAGYLVQRRPGSNQWDFFQIPELYKEVPVEDIETYLEAEVANQRNEAVDLRYSEEDTENFQSSEGQLPEEGTVYPVRGVPYIPERGGCTPSNERGNSTLNITSTNTLNNILNNTKDNPQSVFTHMEEENQDEYDIDFSMEEEDNQPIYCDAEFEKMLMEEIQEQERRDKMYLDDDEYREAIESINNLSWEDQQKYWFIRNEVIKSNPRINLKYGLWIKGWDDEKQCPRIEYALYLLPLEELKKKSHDFSGIPDSYFEVAGMKIPF